MRDAMWSNRSFGADADLSEASADMVAQRRMPVSYVRPEPAVYLAEALGTGLVKLGWVMNAKHIQRRLEQLQAGCPYRLRLVFLLGGASRLQEARLHKAFDEYRHDREWFRREGKLARILDLACIDQTLAIMEMEKIAS